MVPHLFTAFSCMLKFTHWRISCSRGRRKITFRALNSSLTPYNNTKMISFVQWVGFERAEMEPVSPAITDRFVTMPTPPLSKLKALHNRAWSKEKLTHSVTGSNRDETCFTRRQFCHNPSPPPLNSKASATEPWAKQENKRIAEKLEMIYLFSRFWDEMTSFTRRVICLPSPQ